MKQERGDGMDAPLQPCGPRQPWTTTFHIYKPGEWLVSACLGLVEVRHPVDRIISDFHYRRSGAYVVASRRDHPADPWPQIPFLRLLDDSMTGVQEGVRGVRAGG